MSENDSSDLFSEFDDGPPDDRSDTGGDPLDRLDAASLLESLSSSDLIPDFADDDDAPPDSSLFQEPPLKEGDTDVPRPPLSDGAHTPLPVKSRATEPIPETERSDVEDGPSEPAYKDDLTPDFASLLDLDELDSMPKEEETPYEAAVTPTLPMPPEKTALEDSLRSELSTEPAPPDTEGIDPTDTPPTGPAGQGDVIVRVFFPRLPGEEVPSGHGAASPPPYAAKADAASRPEDVPIISGRNKEGARSPVEPPASPPPGGPAGKEEPDPAKIETRPHPRPEGGDVVDILAGRSAPSEPEHVPVIQEFSWSEDPEPIVQESVIRDDEAAPPSSAPTGGNRRRGALIWLIVGTIAAVLLIAAGIGLWGVLGPSIGTSLAGLFGDRATPTPPFGVLLEPTTVTETESPARPTKTPVTPPSPTPEAEPPVVLTDDGILLEDIPMVYVPGGSFEMGAGAQTHRVTLSPYYIDTYEVTNQAYARCVEEGSCTEPQSLENYAGDTYYGAPAFLEHPVINVTWDQANTYCQWRSARLPTEAEWEMAARVNPDTGVETVYPWGSQWDPSRLNYCDASCVLAANADPAYNDTWPQTARVGSFPGGASGIGAMDLSGNVSEWVADWFAADYYLISPEQDPTGPDTGPDKVIRGGAWGVSNPDLFLSTARTHFDPTSSGPGTGFRCAVSAAEIEGLPANESQEDT